MAEISDYAKKVLLEAGYTEMDLDNVEAIAESRRTKDAKQENIGEAAGATDSGQVVGATVGGGTVEDLEAELRSLQGKSGTMATHAVMARRRELRKQLDSAMGDVQVTFDRD